MSDRPARVAVIGIDCLTPQLLFDRYLTDLPNVRALVEGHGSWGHLESTVPPITVPAWMCMATSQDPGQLGLYGFRNRVDHSYRELSVADASWLHAPTLWQLLSRRRRRSLVVGVPLTYPPRPILGDLVAGIPAPMDAEVITAPAALRQELDALAGPSGYTVDVGDFRSRPPGDLARALIDLRNQRFGVVEKLAQSREWELLFAVDMSVDRLHHAFWAHGHADHPLHDPDSPFKDLLRDFYRDLDANLGHMIEVLGDETWVIMVSDHGARTMKGGVRFNEWLIDQKLLHLKHRPDRLRRVRHDEIDFGRTRVWSDGGYYARFFLNVRGREPQGTIDDPTALLADLQESLASMPGPDGKPLGNRSFLPSEIYRDCNNVPPDLIVYPGDLDYRANATIFPDRDLPSASERLFAVENDSGLDGANHAQDGILLVRPGRGGRKIPAGRLDASIYDVAPTVLDLLEMPVPDDMIGRTLLKTVHAN